MHARIDGEKKGLIPLTQEQMAGQIATYQILKDMTTLSQQPPQPGAVAVLPVVPATQPFTIERPAILAALQSPAEVSEVENLEPGTRITKTELVRLVRDEQPLTFDVISLSRNVAAEETTLAQTDWGQVDEIGGGGDDEGGGGGGEGENDEEY